MAEDAGYVAGHIQERLAEHPDIAELGIRATVHGDAVFLRGDVASEQRRERIRAAVRELVGDDLTVHDELVVTAATAPTGSEELR
jgi:osmotically-inducible protein OsmY